MALLRRLLITAARRLAADPRLQAKAAEVLERKIKPRAKEAWRRTKPKIEAARDELKEIVRETDPRRHPKRFAARVRDRILERTRRR